MGHTSRLWWNSPAKIYDSYYFTIFRISGFSVAVWLVLYETVSLQRESTGAKKKTNKINKNKLDIAGPIWASRQRNNFSVPGLSVTLTYRLRVLGDFNVTIGSLCEPNVSYGSLCAPDVSYGFLREPNVSYRPLCEPNVIYGSLCEPNISYGFLREPNVSYGSPCDPNVNPGSLY